MSTGAAAGAPAASDGGDAGQNGQAQHGNVDAGQQQAGRDVSPLADQLGQLTDGQQQLRDFLQSAPWRQDGELEGDEFEDGELDLSELDGLDDVWEHGTGEFGQDASEIPGVDMDDPQAVTEHLSQRLDEAVHEGVHELSQQLYAELDEAHEAIDEQRRLREGADLVAEFPEFGDPETAREIVGYSHQVAEAYGHPELAQEPWFWRITYMSHRAGQYQQEEAEMAAEAPAGAHLEGGGGANPGGGLTDPGDALMRRLLHGGPLGSRALPFQGGGS